jgi:conjugative relaxase-like TrwC/TraI family protein
MKSIAMIGAIQGEHYHAKDQCYHNKDSAGDDVWQGKMDGMGVKDSQPVQTEDFVKALKSIETKNAAIDTCFSAPKSVSVAMVNDNDMSANIIAAQNKAVNYVLAEMETEIQARITKNGVTERVKTGNMMAAKFNHFVSRNHDMQLHTHCVILNKTEYNGKTYAIAADNLFRDNILHGQLYRNRLAKNLQEMGYKCKITDNVNGFFELEGIDKETIDQFSTRRKEILTKLKDWNEDSAASADKATLLTRKAKVSKDFKILEESWQEQLKDCNINISKCDPIIPTVEDKAEAFKRAVERLANGQFAFAERELERAVMAEGCLAGMDRTDVKTQIKNHLDTNAVIRLGKAKNDTENTYYTTKKNLEIEKEIVNNVTSTNGTKNGIDHAKAKADLTAINNQLPTDKKLSTEQKQAIMHIATTKNQYVAVEGLAGTGKTYMLSAGRQVLEQNGYIVKGAAFAGRAADGLQADTGIKSTTIHSLLNKLEREAGNAVEGQDLTQKTEWNFDGLKPSSKPEIWVVDEAGLVDNNIMLQIQRAANLKNAKVIFTGDTRQLQPVGVGNAYTNMIRSDKLSTCYLTDIRRQQNKTLLQAVREVVKGDINQSLQLTNDSTFEVKSAKKRFATITKEYTSLSAAEQNDTVILTARNKDRVELNVQVREQLVKNGSLAKGQEFKVQVGKAEVIRNFAAGDRIMFLQNDHKLEVKNGQAGKITEIKGDIITVQSGKKTFSFNGKEYNKFDHGYAMTTYKAQGITADRVLINFDSSQQALNTRNSYYVDISRARHKVSIYTDNQAKMCKQVTDFVKKVSSEDFLIVNNYVPTTPKPIPKTIQKPSISVKKVKATELTIPLPGPLKILRMPVKVAQKTVKAAATVVKTAINTTKAINTLANTSSQDEQQKSKMKIRR